MERYTEYDEYGEVYVKQHDYIGASKRLAEYEDAEEQGVLLPLPCAIGDTVYVITICETIPTQLDGTYYDVNGDIGTATGYYCPYEEHCPFDDENFDSCDNYKKEMAVFEDTVSQIMIDESGVHICTKNCCVLGFLGDDIFLEQEQANLVLKNRKAE